MENNEKASFEADFRPSPDRMAEAFGAAMPLWQKIVLYALGVICLMEALGYVGAMRNYSQLEQMGLMDLPAYWAYVRPVTRAVVFLLVGIGCFALRFLLPRFKARKFCGDFRRTSEGQAASYIIAFENEGLKVRIGEREPALLRYGELRLVRETKRLIMLQTEAKDVYCIEKTSLSGGDLTAFLVFLEEKAPRAAFRYGVKR